MAGIGELITGTVETALVFVPGLLEVPILGRLLVALGFGHGGSDTKALEQLERIAQEKAQDRATRIKRNGRYLLRASDAMQCVETHLTGGSILLNLGKGIVNVVLGKPGTAIDELYDRIFTCIEEKVLRQDTPRVKGSPKGSYVRPRKGHGYGRGSF